MNDLQERRGKKKEAGKREGDCEGEEGDVSRTTERGPNCRTPLLLGTAEVEKTGSL